VRFEIQRYVVDGNTILSQGELDRILNPFAGKDRDFGDIQRASSLAGSLCRARLHACGSVRSRTSARSGAMRVVEPDPAASRSRQPLLRRGHVKRGCLR